MAEALRQALDDRLGPQTAQRFEPYLEGLVRHGYTPQDLPHTSLDGLVRAGLTTALADRIIDAYKAPPPVIAAGRTAYEAVNAPLPRGETSLAWLNPSSGSKPSNMFQPTQVLRWEDAYPGTASCSLDIEIRAYQSAADKQESRLTRPPAVLTTPMDSEAEVSGALQSCVAENLNWMAPRLRDGKQAVWRVIPPKELLQDADTYEAKHEVEIEAPPLQRTRSGRMIKPPPAGLPELQAASPSESNSNRKMDLVLAVKEEPAEQGKPPAKRRCICVGEVKRPGALLSSTQDLPDLVAAYHQQHSDHHQQAVVAAIKQIYTYLQLWRMCYGYISCWFGTWLVQCPPRDRGTLYVSQAYSASSAGPAVTVLGALAWLQDKALQVDQDQVDKYIPPTAGEAGASGDGTSDSGEDDGAKDGSQEWTPKQDQHQRHAGSSKGRNKGRSGGSSSRRPEQQGRTCTLLLQHKLQEGSAGAVVVGALGGVPAIVKLLGPDRPGLRAYEVEVAVYSMLAPVQGVVVPRLLGAGSLPGGVAFIATSREDGAPLSSFCTVAPAVAAAALQALETLHREFAGFLHNDIRLANILLLSGPGGSDVSPQCMILDFGRSRVDGTKDEQRREYRVLKKMLGV